jgi:glutaredoxin-related protein
MLYLSIKKLRTNADGGTLMLKMYGTDICVDCRETKADFEDRKIPYEYVDITENTTNLKEFLKFRDRLSIFQKIKENGSIGIPFFVLDEKYTHDPEEALSWIR